MPRPVSNPPNPWESRSVEWLEEPPTARLEVFEEDARTVLSRNESPDVPFRFSVNPYRGCQHACAYCYARPSHQYLSFGAGTDFDKKIVVKRNAPDCLHRELSRRSWSGEEITFSGNTDCYQPLEASYELTRRCLEVCLRHENPVAVITKAALVRRDGELLAELSRRAGAQVFLSIPFADSENARRIEPGASTPAARFDALAHLAELGIETGVAVAPVIPGLNDAEIPRILRQAAEAGARRAFLILLRLPAEVLPVFRERLEEAFPERAAHVLSALSDTRGGRLTDPRFGERMRGSGARWAAIRDLFEVQARRHGLVHRAGAAEPLAGERRRRGRPIQGSLFP